MKQILSSCGEEVRELIRFLGIPPNSREFTLHVCIGEAPTVTVTYYPSKKDTTTIKETRGLFSRGEWELP